MAVQFHPEFKSKPTRAHPLFREFIAAALRQRGATRAATGAELDARAVGVVNGEASPDPGTRADDDHRAELPRWPLDRAGHRDGTIASLARGRWSGGPASPADDWIAPAFWDIQINGRWGHSFSEPGLTVEQVAEIVRAQAAARHGAALPDA